MYEQRLDNTQSYIFRSLLMIGILIIASLVGYIFYRVGFPETNIVMVYLLGVLVTAWMTDGFIFGILASVIATFTFNFFFTVPLFTFTVDDPSYIITFATMTLTAIITSTLTSHVKHSARISREKEAETKAVYNLTTQLTDAKNLHDITSIAVSVISSCFFCEAALLRLDDNGFPEQMYLQQITPEKQIHRKVQDGMAIKNSIEQTHSVYAVGTEFYEWPIHGRECILGLIRIPKEIAQIMNDAQQRLLHSMIESVAMAMDRLRSSEQHIKAREEAVQERYRSNLLRAISHDLRTPLSGIMGTSEMLMDMIKPADFRYSLVKGIHADAEWLHSLVENILNLTRLQDGKLVLEKEMEAVEEVIGSAVERITVRLPEHEITVTVPDELLLVPMDARLIEQVIINLLDNAIKHSPSKAQISISATKDETVHSAVFVIKDKGSGIAASDLPHIFDMFYTSSLKRTDSKHGIGLGLAICDSIIKAHGGSIEARNRIDGKGAEFIFMLPLGGETNEQS